MNIQELINVPRIVFPVGTEVLIKGKIVGLRVLDDRFVENVVKLDYGEQIIAPNAAIYVKDEPEKVTIPQFVADWIEKIKNELSLREAMSQGYAPHEVDSWLREMDQDGACLNQEIFARAWIDGYEVEEEKRYLVKVKGFSGYGRYLNKVLLSKEYFLASKTETNGYRTKHTRKELEEAGFGWVFDCEGVEIEEVE